jgi:DNA (cytosine-5)-methyltransferase 1
MRAISLFAGAGGCSLGFMQSGFEIISAYDNDPNAINTYNKNFGEGKCQNVDLANCNFTQIRDRLGLKRGELDLIIGGPPCQGFTTAGSKSKDDIRNKLVHNYSQALEIFAPRWFVMENVEGILTTAKGNYIIDFLNKIIELGYSVSMEKIYAHEYGVPQRRKRVFIIGNLEGINYSFPQPLIKAHGAIYRNGIRSLRDAIVDLENLILTEIDHRPKQETGIRLERIINLMVDRKSVV